MKRHPKPQTPISDVPAWALESKITPQHQRVASRPAGSTADFCSSSTTFVRVNQAGAFLQVSAKSIRRLISRGDLKAVRIGRSVRIHFSELENLIAGGGCNASVSGGGGDHV